MMHSEFLQKTADILEIDKVDLDLRFKDCSSWDSLSALAIIAHVNRIYGKTIYLKDLIDIDTISDLLNRISD